MSGATQQMLLLADIDGFPRIVAEVAIKICVVFLAAAVMASRGLEIVRRPALFRLGDRFSRLPAVADLTLAPFPNSTAASPGLASAREK